MPDLLVLWDVDHTLIELRRLHYDLYRQAFTALTGRAPDRLLEMSGRTDRASMTRTLRDHGLHASEEQLLRFRALLVAAMAEVSADLPALGHPVPGAAAAVQALSVLPGVHQSVLTGNLRPLAEAKLSAFGFASLLDFDIGAYGWDHVDRGRLVPVARQRASNRLGVVFSAARTVLVGDTPRDVQAAREGGGRSIAVATGAFTEAELLAAGADVVLPRLTDTAAVVRAVVHGEGPVQGETRPRTW